MGTPTSNPLQQNFDSISSILSLFTDKKVKTTQSTSGGSQTEQTMFDPKAIESMLRTLMEGSSGLAAVSSGQKAPGLYNSSTRQLMTNDLLARVTGQVAEKSAVRVTNKDPITQTSTVKTDAPISASTGLIGGAALLLSSKKARNKLFEGLGLDELLSLGIPLESGTSGAGVTSNAGQGVNFDWNNSARFPTAFAGGIGESFSEPMSSNAMSAAAFEQPAAAPAPTPEPEPTPAPEPVVTPPTVDAVPDVVAPPAPAPAPVVTPTPAAPFVAPPPPTFVAPAKVNQVKAVYDDYIARLAVYNSTYGTGYTYNPYTNVLVNTGGAAKQPNYGGSTSTPNIGYNPTVDNLFQGQPGAPGSSGGSVSVGTSGSFFP